MTTLSQVYVHVVADRLLLIMSRRILNNRWDLKNFLFILLLFFKLFLVVLNDNTRISPRADKRRPEKVYYVGITNKYPTTRFFALASSDRNLEIECPRRLRNFLGQRNSFVFFGTCFMFPDILQWHWYEFKFILLFHFFCFAICLFLQRICIWTGVTQKRPDRIPAKKKKSYMQNIATSIVSFWAQCFIVDHQSSSFFFSKRDSLFMIWSKGRNVQWVPFVTLDVFFVVGVVVCCFLHQKNSSRFLSVTCFFTRS